MARRSVASRRESRKSIARPPDVMAIARPYKYMKKQPYIDEKGVPPYVPQETESSLTIESTHALPGMQNGYCRCTCQGQNSVYCLCYEVPEGWSQAWASLLLTVLPVFRGLPARQYLLSRTPRIAAVAGLHLP